MSRPPPETASRIAARLKPRRPRRAARPGKRLAAADVRALLRLANELRDAPTDPGSRKRRLLEGLCRLLRADAGICVVTHATTSAGHDSVVTAVRWRMTLADADAWARRLPSTGAGGNARATFESGGTLALADHCVESVLPAVGGRLRACVTLLHRPPGPRPFSPRERSMFELFHSESHWLYRTDVPLATPAGRSLTPRQRQTLQFLLAGHGEKQIAARLGLSPNTVHHYVKAIHRHFRVSSRGELLAKWVRG